MSATSDGRGCTAGQNNSGNAGRLQIDYITIATLGNAQDFGNASVGRGTGATGTNSATRALFFGGGGAWNTATNTIDYVTIATTGNGTDFGDMTQLVGYAASCGDETRAIRFGGYANGPFGNTALMDYITMATTGNATSFGTLHGPSQGEGVGACSDNTKAVCAGGLNAAGSPDSGMVKVTIQTTGNSLSLIHI